MRVTGANVKEIEKLLKQAVANNPASVRARVHLINFYLRSRDAKTALAAAQEAQAAMPSDLALNAALGATQLAAGAPRQAIATFSKLVELAPQSPRPLLQLAKAHTAAKQPEEALKALRAALELRPGLTGAHREIAAIYLSTGRIDEALRTAREMQATQPTVPASYALEAEIHAAQKDFASAERIYRAALKKFDHPLLAARTHALLTAAGKPAEANALTEDWIKRHPNDAVVLAYLGERDLAAKRYASAADRYRAALEKQPNNALYLNNLAWTSHVLKRPEALQYAERAHELVPTDASIMDTLGSILMQRGEEERGLELLGRAAELAPDAHRIRLNFAKALIQVGRKGAARNELQLLTKIDSRHPVQKEAAALLAGL
jgi:putative PEP-CTERM system TPR-repeat lipoprotein